MRHYARSLLRLIVMAAVVAPLAAMPAAAQDPPVYQTYGVHNPPSDSPCGTPNCVYTRLPGQPSDPHYPDYWTAHWRMYRVFNYVKDGKPYVPPYDHAPPRALKPGLDYEVSEGATYYDNSWRGPTGQGAMMEHYEKRCLPIFPISNQYSCSFISLGDVAFFLTYPQDRPKGMPPVCLFSSLNHPPRPDFIAHLPYSASDSAQLGYRIQGYSFWIDAQTGKVGQVGVLPDQTANAQIMFGYGFDSRATPDRVNKTAAPYRHPQSFYFSGVPVSPPDAPFVSQNYTDFAMVRPDPKDTWNQVSALDPKTLPACQLFNPPGAQLLSASGKKVPTWGDLQQHH